MGNVNFVHQRQACASRSSTRGNRMTIDFRRHGPALAAIAQSRRMTSAALARAVVCDWLEAHTVDASPTNAIDTALDGSVLLQKDAPFAKMTLRMPADRAAKLARQARAAELSQGMYVAQLLDEQSDAPLLVSPRETLAALVRSNAELAALYGDLRSLVRALKLVPYPELADIDVLAAGLVEDMSRHLDSTAAQLATLPASWRRVAGKGD